MQLRHVSGIKPNSIVLNQLFGGFTGLSLLPIIFDWTYVSAPVFLSTSIGAANMSPAISQIT